MVHFLESEHICRLTRNVYHIFIRIQRNSPAVFDLGQVYCFVNFNIFSESSKVHVYNIMYTYNIRVEFACIVRTGDFVGNYVDS